MEQMEPGDQVHSQILQLLKEAGRPLSTRAIGARLRFEDVQLADHQVVEELKKLRDDDEIILEGAKWSATNSKSFRRQSERDIRKNLPLVYPTLSTGTNTRLGWQPPPIEPSTVDKTASRQDLIPPSNVKADLNGRWSLFRRLIEYYRQCIRNEEGAKAIAFQNELFERFI